MLDKSLAELDLLLKDLDTFIHNHYNEADTRVKFIDPLLTRVLGWDEHIHIRREKNHQQEDEKRCIDYVLSLLEPVLVVEAKRVLKDFEIPTAIERIEYSLSDKGVIRTWTNAWAAICQVQEYCVDVGARYALVTNGRQWIGFKAVSERGAWTNGKALVIASPSALRKHFTFFYECFSKEAISQDKLSEFAFPREPSEARQKPRRSITASNSGYRNELYTVLDSAFREILLDVPTNAPNFLKECYCSSEDAMRYRGQLNTAVVDPLPIFRSPVEEIRPGHRKDAFAKTVGNSAPPGQNANPLFVVMGGAGVGKTTFLHWYFDEELPSEAKTNTLVVYCDYRTIECTIDELHTRTLKVVIDGIRSKTQEHTSNFNQLYEIFRSRIDLELKGSLRPYAKDSAAREMRISDLLVEYQDYGPDHLKALVSYLRRHGKQTVIILDNMDQKSPELQDKLYQIGHEFVYGCAATVVVSLQEATFRRMTRSATFNAFASVEFHLKAQPIDLILEKRLNYLTKKLGGTQVSIYTPDGKTLDVADFDRFLNLLGASLLSGNADQRILECVTAISNGNIRTQLDMIYSFLVSGQTKISEYFWDYARNQESLIPFHEFLHSLLQEDRKFFDEGAGHWFMNVFEPAPQANASSFTALRILEYLQTGLGQTGELRPADFVGFDQIFEAFAPYGWSRSEITFNVQRLAYFGLLAPESGDNKSLLVDTSYALTKSGTYYIDTLYCQFSYFSSVACDTTVSELEVANELADILRGSLGGPKIPLRARRLIAEKFIGYLGAKESLETKGAIAKHPILASITFVPRMVEALKTIPLA